MELFRILGIKPGVSGIIGSGGKSTLLRTLGEELPGRVILCTTTHIMPFPGLELYTGVSVEELSELLAEHRLVCGGRRSPEGKLIAPGLSMEAMARVAD